MENILTREIIINNRDKTSKYKFKILKKDTKYTFEIYTFENGNFIKDIKKDLYIGILNVEVLLNKETILQIMRADLEKPWSEKVGDFDDKCLEYTIKITYGTRNKPIPIFLQPSS